MTADPLFYEVFKEIPELFFELIGHCEGRRKREEGRSLNVWKKLLLLPN
ncbi:MAG: hypothetical protein HC815_35735 [Richelia sp. RM1_1_1]|nr:hypothetical protein [Richelia sp. RM1_1_1]